MIVRKQAFINWMSLCKNHEGDPRVALGLTILGQTRETAVDFKIFVKPEQVSKEAMHVWLTRDEDTTVVADIQLPDGVGPIVGEFFNGKQVYSLRTEEVPLVQVLTARYLGESRIGEAVSLTKMLEAI